MRKRGPQFWLLALGETLCHCTAERIPEEKTRHLLFLDEESFPVFEKSQAPRHGAIVEKMRYRLDHARIALLGTLLLVGVQFVVFSRISDCPRYLSDDSPLLLRNLIRPDFRGITSSSRKTSVAEDYDDTGSACILICDDNHFLIGT
eukprot:scaffold23911_cov127-Cylindrotheca_fusiformis.AAC.7